MSSAAPPRTLAQAIAGIRRRRLHPDDVWRHCRDNLRAAEWQNAFISVAEAREQGDVSENGGILSGLPVAVKDNFCTAGELATTAASRMLRGWNAGYDATAVARLKDAGAFVMGKTNLDEFAMGYGTFSSDWGPTYNPWSPLEASGKRTLYVPGGSSGGSAAAVANGSCLAALGSDTGGSIRQPASYCGVVGFKPGYGSISRHGLISYASSLDTVGIIARTVLDSAIVYDQIQGGCPRDSTSRPGRRDEGRPHALLRDAYGVSEAEDLWQLLEKPEEILGRSARPLDGVTVGVPDEFFVAEVREDVVRVWEHAASLCQSLGANVVRVRLPSLATGVSLATYAVLSCSEASSNLARYDGVRYGHRTERKFPEERGDGRMDAEAFHTMVTDSRAEGLGLPVQNRILLGTYCLSKGGYSDFYVAAQNARRRIRQEMLQALGVSSDGSDGSKPVDVMLTPTTPTGAFLTPKSSEDTPSYLELMVNDVMTLPANLGGLPAISVPAGMVQDSSTGAQLPIGVQLIGPPIREAHLLRIATSLERALGATSRFEVPEG